MDKRLGAILGVVALVAVVVVVLVTGGTTGSPGDDAGGDVSVEGDGEPDQSDLADVTSTDVRREGNELLFIAEMARDVPQEIDKGSLELRWDLSVEGRDAWILSAFIGTDTIAAITSQQTTYGSSTIDGTMPGSLRIDGSTVTIRVRPGNIEGFPNAFQWRLRTTLDADRADPKSAVAHDDAPDGGPGTFE